MNLKLLLLVFVVMLSGCSESQAGPSANYFKVFLDKRMTEGLKVTDISVEAAENIGTAVEPVFKSRIKGKVILTENYYKREGFVTDKSVLVRMSKKGTTLKLYGLAISKLKQDKWKIKFSEISMTPRFEGRPQSHWGKGTYVIKGSAEEKKLKIKQEAANKVWRNKMKKLRAFMTGKWVTKKPITERNGKYTAIGGLVNSRSHEYVMYSLNIPKGSELKGTATATLFGSKNYHKPITIRVSYKMIDIGEVHIKELDQKCIERWCTSDSWTLNSTDKGVLIGSSRGGRNAYRMNLFRK